MKALSKKQIEQKESLATDLENMGDELSQAITTFDDKMRELFAPVQVAMDDYNGAVGAWNEFREGVHGEMEEYYEERSEKWKEGEKGDAYQTWMQSYEEEVPEVDIDMPEELEEAEIASRDDIDNLTDEPD